ncbi:J domain-containing protein [Tsuneonella amylolytica]|uniref:J domain-containing protein n=1 Tax=Tsuneonella amylolytica TaxID=2338327 RepID=UPI000EA943B2|nr:J domain-containing protein [Tsuneonella amylolytica]
MPRSVPEFIDFYEVLHVDPGCSQRELEVAFHLLAKRFHPDSPDTTDIDRFDEVTAAYRVLRDPVARKEYDDRFFPNRQETITNGRCDDADALDERTAVSDAEMHSRILLALYKRRRAHPTDASVGQWHLQQAIGCSPDSFDFHMWYLKSKGFVEVAEDSGFVITIGGVDEVISQSRAHRAERLLLTLADPDEENGGSR